MDACSALKQYDHPAVHADWAMSLDANDFFWPEIAACFPAVCN
jgi:hypothetical protein